MKIVEPKAELWLQGNSELAAKEHVAKCASVCYQSGEKLGEKAEKFYNALISSNHVSTLRHESCYYILNIDFYLECVDFAMTEWDNCPYTDYKVKGTELYIATNANYVLDNQELFNPIKTSKVSPEEFKKDCPELMRYTICITTSIDISREYNRVSPNNISEESTRYCNYSKDKFDNEITVIRPSFVHTKPGEVTAADIMWSNAMIEAEKNYFSLLEQGWKPEEARKVLPLATKTTVVYTYSIREWESILQKRMLNTTGKAHPDAIKLAELIYKELTKEGYYFNEDNQLYYKIN